MADPRSTVTKVVWAMVAFGWPAVAAAFAAFGVALLTRSTLLGFVGAAIATPFCVFVTGYPLFHWAGWVALVANVLAAHVLRRRPDVAFAALLPFMMIASLLAVFALRGITLIRR